MPRDYPRPAGLVSAWTITQASRYIRSAIQNGAQLFFVDHAQDRQIERSVSAADAGKAVTDGNAMRYEPSPKVAGAMRCRFDHQRAARLVSTVVEVNDEDPTAFIVVTVMAKRK